MRAWLRGHPRQADVLLAVLLFAVSVGQLTAGPASAASRVAFIAVTVLLAATVVPRRRYPVAAFAVAAAEQDRAGSQQDRGVAGEHRELAPG